MIIRFDLERTAKAEYPQGAFCPLGGQDHAPNILVLWYTHEGLCIRESEENGYHDSDFYMLVWNPETLAPERICFASTRGWTYPSYGSKPDATPETLAAYDAYCKAQIEQHKQHLIECDLERTAKREALAASLGLDGDALNALAATIEPAQFKRVEKLLTSNLRSSFRLSLRAQLIEWLNGKRPGYSSPFSRRQWDFI